MYISKLNIKNFKSINTLQVNFDPTFNVLIGQNNCGKTTILESMLVWKRCFDINITAKSNSFYSNSKNILFDEFEFLRIADDKDVFNLMRNNNKADMEVSLTFVDEEEYFELGFNIAKAGHIDNAYFQISYVDKNEFIRFAKFASEKGKHLKNIISFSNTRPMSNILSKEPYMYTGQIRSKINKGKGFEVLRNKIIRKEEVKQRIEENISDVFEKKVSFVEREKDNREYIKLFVNIDGIENDLLSQGSGFLQIADIFSSFEFSDSLHYILLIDEPDAHIHVSTQRNLVNQFRNIENSQLFVITHNEKFIELINDNEILFINEVDKESGLIKPLERGAKRFVVENLVGEYKDIDKLKNAEKVLFVEGHKDKERIDKLLQKYAEINNIILPGIYIIDLSGIDSVVDKLPVIVDSHKKLIENRISWILLRDTDCVSQRALQDYKNENLNLIYEETKEVIFQDGYELESSIFSDDDLIINLLSNYYSTNVEKIYHTCKEELYNARLIITSDVHKTLSYNFNRQKELRKGKVYSKLKFDEFLEDISITKFHMLLCKKNIDLFLTNIHEKLITSKSISDSCIKLDSQTIFDDYFSNININSNFVSAHIDLISTLIS